MEYEQNTSTEKHMQSLTPVVKKRSPVLLKVLSAENNKLLYEKEFVPRGVRNDIAMFIYTQLVLSDDAVNVELTETAFPDKKYQLNHIKLKKGDGTFVIFKDNALRLAGGK